MSQDNDRTDIPRPVRTDRTDRTDRTEPEPTPGRDTIPPSDAEPPRHRDEVRAGPGDAGRSDRPEPLPKAPNEGRRGRQALWLFLALAIFAVLFIVAL